MTTATVLLCTAKYVKLRKQVGKSIHQKVLILIYAVTAVTSIYIMISLWRRRIFIEYKKASFKVVSNSVSFA